MTDSLIVVGTWTGVCRTRPGRIKQGAAPGSDTRPVQPPVNLNTSEL